MALHSIPNAFRMGSRVSQNGELGHEGAAAVVVVVEVVTRGEEVVEVEVEVGEEGRELEESMISEIQSVGAVVEESKQIGETRSTVIFLSQRYGYMTAALERQPVMSKIDVCQCVGS